jgi:hypothetical protein
MLFPQGQRNVQDMLLISDDFMVSTAIDSELMDDH